MLIADDDGVLQNVNAAACLLFGRREDELLGTVAEEYTVDDFDFEAAWDTFQDKGDMRGLSR